jgi:hypothetical protein
VTGALQTIGIIKYVLIDILSIDASWHAFSQIKHEAPLKCLINLENSLRLCKSPTLYVPNERSKHRTDL